MLLYKICIGHSMMKSWYFPFSVVEEVWRVCRAQLPVSPPVYTLPLPLKEKWYCIFPSTKHCSHQQKNISNFFPKCFKTKGANPSWPSIVSTSVKHNGESGALQIPQVKSISSSSLIRKWFIGEVISLIWRQNTELWKEASQKRYMARFHDMQLPLSMVKILSQHGLLPKKVCWDTSVRL